MELGARLGAVYLFTPVCARVGRVKSQVNGPYICDPTYTRTRTGLPPPSEEDIRSFVFDSLFDNRWDNDLRVRRISLTADAPSFKVKVPRTSRAGVNETLTGEQVAARLVSVMRSRAHRGKTMDEWRKEQLAWLLDPVRPAKKG